MKPLSPWRTIAFSALGGAVSGLLAFGLSLFEYGNGGGESVRQAVLEHYLGYLVLCNAKLALCLAVAGAFWGTVAGVGLAALASLANRRPGRAPSVAAGGAGLFVATFYELCRWLSDSPGSVATLWPYATSRLDVLYDHVLPWMLDLAAALTGSVLALLVLAALAARAATDLRSRLDATRAALERRLAAITRLVRPATPLILAIGAIGLGAAAGAREPRDGRPNFVFLMSDSLRADRLDAKRGGEPVMPAVARLAEQGTSFRSCFVPIARTTESLVTLMTGTWPRTHGVRTSWEEARPLPVATLPATLAAAGYETIAIGDWSAPDFTKFSMGFARAHVPPETWSLKTFIGRGGRLTALLANLLVPGPIAEAFVPEVAYYPGIDVQALVRPHVVSELERCARGERPFFMTVFTGNTHAPFTPARGHHREFADASYHGPNRYGLWARTVDQALALQSESMRERDLLQLEAVYDASARTFDDEVAVVLERLAALGLESNTIVCVLSDHGTAFYERGSFGQGNEIVSDVSNRIPFVVHDPRSKVPAHAVEHIVREVDIAPTVLDLAGVAAPPSMEGRSLGPYLEGDPVDLHLRAYGETGLWIGKQAWQEEELDFGFPDIAAMSECNDWASGIFRIKPRWVRLMIRAQHRMVRDERWKLVYIPTRSGYRVKLYDVTKGDAGGDVSAENPEVTSQLLAVLRETLAREPAEALNEPLPPPRRRS
jgi:arylsulfatase A-like enzyme